MEIGLTELLQLSSTLGATGVLATIVYLFVRGKIVASAQLGDTRAALATMHEYMQRDEAWKERQEGLTIRMVEAFERIAEGYPVLSNGRRLRDSLQSQKTKPENPTTD